MEIGIQLNHIPVSDVLNVANVEMKIVLVLTIALLFLMEHFAMDAWINVLHNLIANVQRMYASLDVNVLYLTMKYVVDIK